MNKGGSNKNAPPFFPLTFVIKHLLDFLCNRWEYGTIDEQIKAAENQRSQNDTDEHRYGYVKRTLSFTILHCTFGACTKIVKG